MRKQEPVQSYPCMVPPRHARRVEHPHDERVVPSRGALRRLAARLRLASGGASPESD